jgi:hypothetical protein
VVLIDTTGEAPGVHGIGGPPLLFWVWEAGDGHSPDGLNRDPYNGNFWKVSTLIANILKEALSRPKITLYNYDRQYF